MILWYLDISCIHMLYSNYVVLPTLVDLQCMGKGLQIILHLSRKHV